MNKFFFQPQTKVDFHLEIVRNRKLEVKQHHLDEISLLGLLVFSLCCLGNKNPWVLTRIGDHKGFTNHKGFTKTKDSQRQRQRSQGQARQAPIVCLCQADQSHISSFSLGLRRNILLCTSQPIRGSVSQSFLDTTPSGTHHHPLLSNGRTTTTTTTSVIA